jgi:hypothetical protein
MSSSADLLCIYPPKVDEFWPYAEPLLKTACDRCGEWSVAEIKGQINKGALLWIIWDGDAEGRLCHPPCRNQGREDVSGAGLRREQ